MLYLDCGANIFLFPTINYMAQINIDDVVLLMLEKFCAFLFLYQAETDGIHL